MDDLIKEAVNIIPRIYLELCHAIRQHDDLNSLDQLDEKKIFGSKSNVLTLCYKFFKELTRFDLFLKYAEMRNKYNIDPDFVFNGEGICLYGKGQINIGAHSYIGRYSSVQSYNNCSVTIGKKCRISHFVRIYTMNSIADQDFSKEELQQKCGNVSIGDYCWIGTGVFIKEGVTIGENSVIGANSVVIDDIPPYSIAAGNPAKVIKRKSCFQGS